jgi:predicted amidohydrolase YtcJ
MGALLCLGAGAAVGEPAASTADVIYLNARVWTGVPDMASAEAFATRGEHIVAVGSRSEVSALRGAQTQVVDLGNAFVSPGFIDNHVHFLTGGLALAQVDLRDARSRQEFTARIAAAARERPGRWITEGNWDHETWGGELPTRAWIDEATGSTPVFVSRLDGHMALANGEALRRAGISAQTPDPPGGEIVRDAKGEPTGILKDAALDLVMNVIPPPSDAELDAALARATAYALSRGVTQVHDMGMGDWRSLQTYERARDRNALKLRIYAFLALADHERLAVRVREQGKGSDWLRWGALKGFVDGSLGSTTAWFHAPYSDAPKTSGLTVVNPEELKKQVQAADRANLHIAVHAIGDRANDWLLDVYAGLPAQDRDRRLRIEHAQHLTPEAIRKFASLNVIASMQPYHTIDDGRWAAKRIGAERLRGAYAFRSLLEAGAKLTFGSDWPVAPMDPLLGIYAAVTRRTLDDANPDGWIPAEKITVEQALRAYTVTNAYAGLQEQSIGVIAPGRLADFVVLSGSPFEVAANDIPKIRVLRTVVGGREQYKAQ